MSIQQQIKTIADGFNGRIGLSIRNLQTDETVNYHADKIFRTASIIKLGILVTLMRQVEDGATSLDAPIMLRRADVIGGSGVMQYLTSGLTMPVRDYAFLMMNISDNLAANVLIDHVGLEDIQTFMADSGYPDVQLHRKLISGTPPSPLGTASPADLTRLITAVFRRRIISPVACDEMMRMMDGVGSDRIGRYLPFSLYGNYGSEEPEPNKLELAGKTGSNVGLRAQTAVVWHGNWEKAQGFAITVMTEDNPALETWSADAEGTLIIGRIARAAYDEFVN